MQNFAPAGLDAWQDAHTGPGGRGLLRRAALRRAALAPAAAAVLLAALAVGRHALLDRRLLGGRRLRLLVRHLLRPHRAGQPEPGPEERPVHSGAALGHALARAERHLALGVVLEAARQLRVAGVLGQLLELLLVLGGEVDVEVAHPGQLHAVGDELAVGRIDGGLLDLRRVRHQAQDGPSVADDLRGDVSPQHFQQLVADPAGDPLVVGDVDRGGQVGHQPHRVAHAQRIVAEHPKRHDQPGPRVLHVIDPAAELEAGVLAGADEVQLRAVRVPAGDGVDDRAETRELVRVDLVPAGAEGLHDLAGVDEHRHLVRVDDRARETADGDVRPFEDDLTFAVIRYGDELPPEQCHAQNHTGSLDYGIRRCQRSFTAIFRAWK